MIVIFARLSGKIERRTPICNHQNRQLEKPTVHADNVILLRSDQIEFNSVDCLIGIRVAMKRISIS